MSRWKGGEVAAALNNKHIRWNQCSAAVIFTSGELRNRWRQPRRARWQIYCSRSAACQLKRRHLARRLLRPRATGAIIFTRRECSNNYGISTLANKDWKVCAEALMSNQIHVVSPQSSSHFLCHHQNEWLTTPAIPIIPPTAATNGSRLVLEVFGRFFSPLRMLLGTRSFLFLGKSGGFRGVRGRRRQESEQTFGRFLPSSHN